MTRRALQRLLPWVALVAGCGGLDSPDLGTGTLSGRLVDASAGAYVYPLGRPDLKTAVPPDGRWSIREVPIATQAVVLFDGVDRAELVPVEVHGASVTEVGDRAAADMPLAGAIAAFARPEGGCEAVDPRYSVMGTDQVRLAAGGTGVAVLERLPGAVLDLLVEMGGFRDGRMPVTVVPGATVAYEVPLEIETDDDERGCASPGGSCRPGLHCDPAEGICYACLGDGDCAAGATCDEELHVCSAPPAGAGETCAACDAPNQCTSNLCLPSGTSGYCSRACGATADCPAGLDCQGNVCVPIGGCATYLASFGAPCLSSDACKDYLKDGVCLGAAPEANPPVPGYCTGKCLSDGDCVAGYSCQAGLCVR